MMMKPLMSQSKRFRTAQSSECRGFCKATQRDRLLIANSNGCGLSNGMHQGWSSGQDPENMVGVTLVSPFLRTAISHSPAGSSDAFRVSFHG